MGQLRESFRALQESLAAEVSRFYGGRLVSLVVFGSVGRGTQTETSDLDFVVVAEGLPTGRMRRTEEFEEVERALEPLLRELRGAGLSPELSPVFKTPEEATTGSPLFLDLVDDALILFDRDGFFAGVLARLRARLEELGARRCWSGSAWYWDLKPDYRPGEVFEL